MSLINSKNEEALTGIRWFDLHVHARKESFIASQLENQGIECFLPRYKSFRKWSDRMKEVELPLFPSYLFSRFDFQNRRPIVTTSGILQIVGNGRMAIRVSDEQISTILTAYHSRLPHQQCTCIEVTVRLSVPYVSVHGTERFDVT